MINVVIKKIDGHIQKMTVSGHAQYKQKGQDIVCAAVSSATLVTANAIEHLGLNQTIDLTVDEGYFNLKVKSYHETVSKLLDNLEYTLHD
ncbi:MAG: ribosomal-processing cysteine protease Prp, partial [Acholeplasmataceae bacterium]